MYTFYNLKNINGVLLHPWYNYKFCAMYLVNLAMVYGNTHAVQDYVLHNCDKSWAIVYYRFLGRVGSEPISYIALPLNHNFIIMYIDSIS